MEIIIKIINKKPYKKKIIKFDNGTYTGHCINGKPNGHGTFKTLEGEIYKGNFLNGEFHGVGTHEYLDGSVYEGEWKLGQPWNIIGYDKFRQIIVKYAEGQCFLW